ncbi:MAG: hypothetical protein COA79_14865 [Planctomycetota bacterium]|nr:MAG: hypothetical protein COA79_14865 [Planctomycetota bacterium]
MKYFLAILILLLFSGCGNSAPTKKLKKKAYGLASKGKTEELRKLIKENPALANAEVARSSKFLEVVVDTRPPFKNMYKTIEMLLEEGADPNANSSKVLRKAIWHTDPISLKLLLDYGADLNTVYEKKNITLLEYSQSFSDHRLDAITDAWEEGDD